tara:strand:+ start:60 stop:1025 length:966 start_codon:yes stop_codon:yes gene_type:complete
MNIENISEIIKKYKYNYKDCSIKVIASNFINISKQLKFENIRAFDDFNSVMNYLNSTELNYQTKANYLKAIKVLLEAIQSERLILLQYDNQIKDYNTQYRKVNSDGDFTSKKQEDNFITEKEFNSFMLTFKNEIIKEDLLKKKDLDEFEFRKLQIYIMLNIFLKFRFRADIGDMIFINKRELNKIKKDEQKEHNYLLFYKNQFTIILNKYKTDKLGEKSFIVKDRLLSPLLRKYTNITGKGYIFKNNKGEPFSPNLLSQTIIRFFEKRLNKRFSINLMRKAYLTDKYSDDFKKEVVEDMIKDSYIMGHSIETAQTIYKKTL